MREVYDPLSIAFESKELGTLSLLACILFFIEDGQTLWKQALSVFFGVKYSVLKLFCYKAFPK